MCIVFTCGQHTFRKELEGYEGVVCQCQNCGNMSGRVIKDRPFFTFCFVPIIPFTISGFKDIVCHICNFHQPLEHRPDVIAMGHGNAANQLPPNKRAGNQGGDPGGGGNPGGGNQGGNQVRYG